MTRSTPPLELRLLTGDPEEIRALQRVLEAAPRYFEITTGGPPGPAEAHTTFIGLPPGKSFEEKFLYGVHRDGRMIGCVDVIRGYPVREKAVIGLALIEESMQRQGIGRKTISLTEREIANWPEITTLRIGVLRGNADAMAFWRRMGFVETGEIKSVGPSFVSDVVILERPLFRAP